MWIGSAILQAVIKETLDTPDISAILAKGYAEIYKLKPMLNGGEVQSVFKLTQGGPLVKTILDNVVLWQIRNMNESKEKLLEEIEKNPEFFKAPQATK